MEEYKKERVDLIDRHKLLTMNIGDYKMEIFKLGEAVKSAQIKAVVNQERIEELEELLKKTEGGKNALTILDNDSEDKGDTVEEDEEDEEEKVVETPKKKTKAVVKASAKKLPTPKAA